ncbi:Uncharacterised protein [Yersinia intermedia]|uniref:Uncharacterized protein n=2 Tax=Yersinia intermedia TaxID=631 RepID=A0ABX6FB01_YERIN|nr:membrane protein [Yersinia intermedia]QGR67148.1 hypothetical protein FOC38_15095 [Yersinia intermedia]QGR72164.1 hypothetical protein FOC37_18395 [Yersinia intermedia]CRY80739.1 Uncharacterised protein [Yersinia intermedia]VDZ52472.1 Uncharacterised protein [Yersinia intermedia]
MDNKIDSLTREEQLIMLIDKYINDTYNPEDEIYTYKLYLIFVGYHLKYFQPHAIYSDSVSNIDNVMQMFCSVFKCMKSNFIKKLRNKDVIFIQLNALVDYIEGNQIRLEQVYVELKAQYEKREISKGVINKGSSRKRVRL